MVPLSGKNAETRWALIFGLLTSRDPATGRRNLTSVTVGGFDGRTFTAEFEQELDFGSMPMPSRPSLMATSRSASPGSPTGRIFPRRTISRRP